MGTVVEKGGRKKRRRRPRISLLETGVPLSHTNDQQGCLIRTQSSVFSFFIPTTTKEQKRPKTAHKQCVCVCVRVFMCVWYRPE